MQIVDNVVVLIMDSVDIIKGAISKDHVHMFVSMPSKLSISGFLSSAAKAG